MTVLSPAASIAVPSTTSGVYINVVTGASGTAAATGGWDVNPWGSGSAFIWSASSGGIASTGTVPSALAAGSVVGPALTYTVSGSASAYPVNATTFFGFRFVNEADGLLHYGYGTMIVGPTALNRTVGQLWYESAAGTAITIPAVPEPSSLAMVLSGGALGLLVLRRRRRA